MITPGYQVGSRRAWLLTISLTVKFLSKLILQNAILCGAGANAPAPPQRGRGQWYYFENLKVREQSPPHAILEDSVDLLKTNQEFCFLEQ